jgi:hypothetical protein
LLTPFRTSAGKTEKGKTIARVSIQTPVVPVVSFGEFCFSFDLISI